MSALPRHGLRVLTIAAMATLWASSATAADLFSTPKASTAAEARPTQGAARQRVVAVNAEAIADGQVAPELAIELFPGLSATFRTTGAEPAFGGGAVISAEAGTEGEATLVARGGKVTGRVTLRGKTYSIRPLGGRLHAVSEISRRLLPPSGPERPSPISATSAASTLAPAGDGLGKATIDVMFVYTARAAAASGDIAAEVTLATAITNEAYKASGVKMRMRLVKALQSGAYDEETRSYEEVLDDLTGHGAQAAFFDETRRVRDEVGADFVVLLREGGGYCGLAWVNTQPVGADAWAFSEVSRGICVDVDSVAHEVGHNMGLKHDRYVSAPAPDSEYNFGFVSIPARAMDIMAYTNKCDDAGKSCDYQRLFSSPKLDVNGRKFGKKAGKPGAADAVRWLNEIRWIAAGLRPTAIADVAAKD